MVRGNEEILVTAQEARRLLGGISRATLSRYVADGMLSPTFRRGWYRKSEIMMLICGDQETFNVGVERLIRDFTSDASKLRGLRPGTPKCMRALRSLNICLHHVYSLGEMTLLLGADHSA